MNREPNPSEMATLLNQLANIDSPGNLFPNLMEGGKHFFQIHLLCVFHRRDQTSDFFTSSTDDVRGSLLRLS